MPFEGGRGQFAKTLAIAFGKAPKVQEAVVQGDLGNVAHRACRVLQGGMNALELALAHIALGRQTGMALEQ
ncbi:hypothetical protein D9M73_166840 [compost metagenome]